MGSQRIRLKKLKPYIWLKKKLDTNDDVVGYQMHAHVFVPEVKGGILNVNSYATFRKNVVFGNGGGCGETNGIKFTIFLSKKSKADLKTEVDAFPGIDDREYFDAPKTPFFIYEKFDVTAADIAADRHQFQVFVDGSNLPGGQGSGVVNQKDADEDDE